MRSTSHWLSIAALALLLQLSALLLLSRRMPLVVGCSWVTRLGLINCINLTCLVVKGVVLFIDIHESPEVFGGLIYY